MISFLDTIQTLFGRGVSFSIQEYLFCLSVVLGEDKNVAYALAFDPIGFKKVLGTEEEMDFVKSKKNNCDILLQQQHIVKLQQELEDLYRSDIQQEALNLKDYKFTGGQIAQILQNLLHNRVADLDSASAKDVISLIKVLTEQFGLDGGGDFEKHFIQVYPPFNAMCTSCNHEFDVYPGIDCVCPHCQQVYHWTEEENRFYPRPSKL